MAIGVGEIAVVAGGASPAARSVAQSAFHPRQLTEAIHLVTARTGNTEMCERTQRVFNVGRFGQHQNERSGQIAQPSDLSLRGSAAASDDEPPSFARI